MKGRDLVKLDLAQYDDIKFFDDKPKWFVPDPYEQYDIYTSEDFENYYLFIDKKKKSIFFTQYQV